MTSPKLSNDCELVFVDGVCDLVNDTDDVIQAIRIELEQNKGQFALNSTWGTPYLNASNTGILQEKVSEDRILLEISKVIKKYKEVEKINSINFVDGKVNAEIQIKGGVFNIASY